MGITDFFTDVWETFSHPPADAEEAKGDDKNKSSEDDSGDDGDDGKKDSKKDKKKDDDEGDDEEPEEEEEEEEEPDPKEQLEKECSESKECHGAKHHYDECAERVTGQIENDGKASEDCVEEFFHLAHCATACAAPKLFAKLK